MLRLYKYFVPNGTPDSDRRDVYRDSERFYRKRQPEEVGRDRSAGSQFKIGSQSASEGISGSLEE
ncbi:MAG: hypothetical protein QOK48_542 [Blastocatellia bacterium]|nr:hypothetical protein [Blastocatellia bacterium]